VTVNAVAPGCVETRLAASIPPEERARYIGAIPGCFSAREEVAVVVGFPRRRRRIVREWRDG